ncbi:MAG: hypothetical protein R3F34_09775 [Planctomycetota bacterium]
MPRDSESVDREHLRLLSIFHYVLAGITGVGALFPVIHLAVGIAILAGALPETAGEDPPEFVGWLFVAFAGVFIVVGLAMAYALFVAGRKLGRIRGRTYCLVVAAISCVIVPLGTVLGVFTLVVLGRPSVQDLFRESEYGTGAP